ncbi:MAG TPA: FecR domain-containing protein, partial [Polyangia bacterium]
MTTGAERVTDALEGVSAWVRDASAPMTPAQHQAGLQAVTFRLEQDRRRRGRPGRRLGAALACAGAVAGALALGIPRLARGPAPSEARPLTFVVDGGAVGDGGYVLSQTASGARVRFSEGTEVHLLGGARGRLGTVDAAGARFAIEQGAAEVRVTPRPGARWLVDAGPFLIRVRGTVFTAAWDAGGERLDIDMEKGRVSVTGPVAEGEVSVRAGQHLTVNVPRKEVVLRERETGLPTAPSESADHAGGSPGWA